MNHEPPFLKSELRNFPVGVDLFDGLRSDAHLLVLIY